MFFKEIDDKAHYSLLHLATEDDVDYDNPQVVDYLLRDANFMYFFRDLLISEHLTQGLHEKDQNVALELMDIFYKGVKNSDDTDVKDLFTNLESKDKDFLFILMKRLLLTFG
ncbi:hypothetical protein KY321_03035, partial [Candidatus Woesearchaeota archaeon]|nr:hypothetical protein [Candidatus Woesearchaeota archaeon]